MFDEFLECARLGSASDLEQPLLPLLRQQPGQLIGGGAGAPFSRPYEGVFDFAKRGAEKDGEHDDDDRTDQHRHADAK
jgi:hypothetical protein